MVFNTGAALLDAIVLAVVSREPQGTYGYKITQDVRQVLEVSESTLTRCSGGCKRMKCFLCTTGNAPAETEDITRLHPPGRKNLGNT